MHAHLPAFAAAAFLATLMASPGVSHADTPEPGRVGGGPGEGVTFVTPGGAFSLELRARAQLRATFFAPDEDPDEIGFNIRRMRLSLRANAPRWNLSFRLQLGMAPLDLDPAAPNIVRDAVVDWRPTPGFRLRVGQTKVAFNRERVISSSSLAFVDRSAVNAEFNLDRDMGLQFIFEDLDGAKHLSLQLGVFGGDGRGVVNRDTGLLYTARIEYRLDPKADDLAMADLRADDHRPQLSIGLGGAFNDRSRRARSTHGNILADATFDLWHGELDFIYKHCGWFVQGEFLLRKATRDTHVSVNIDGVETTTRTGSGLGWFISAGHSFTPEWMTALRYSEVHPWDDASSLSVNRELRATVGWFISDHDFKVQADWGWIFVDDFATGDFEMRVQTQTFF